MKTGIPWWHLVTFLHVVCINMTSVVWSQWWPQWPHWPQTRVHYTEAGNKPIIARGDPCQCLWRTHAASFTTLTLPISPRGTRPVINPYYTVVLRQTAVTAYFISEQLLLFVFANKYGINCILHMAMSLSLFLRWLLNIHDISMLKISDYELNISSFQLNILSSQLNISSCKLEIYVVVNWINRKYNSIYRVVNPSSEYIEFLNSNTHISSS